MKKALLVGCGGYGAGYVEEILKSGNKLGLALSGIVDPYAEQSRVCGLIRENRIPVYRDVPAYYRENRADVAVVSTPIPLHRRQAEEVMRNGSDLLLEKPIAGSSADAEAILRTRDETGRKLTVGFQWCFNPEMLRLKKDADEGLFGRLLSMKALVLWPRDFAYFNRGTRWAGTKYAPDGTAVFDSIASNAAAHNLFNMLWMARRGYGASEARLTGFFAARANDVETFDTIALQAETEKGVPLFFAASHAVKNEERQDPVFVYRFEKATVTFGELPDRPTALLAHYGDGRTVEPLRLCALSMPCVSLCAAMSGYFTACGRLKHPTLIHLAEQLLGVALAAHFLRQAPQGDLEAACAAVVCGQVLADLAALLLMALACRADRQRYFPLRASGRGQTRRLLTISLPLAASAYARSGLSTAQQLLIPRGLRASGAGAEDALAGYGVVHGMALPLLLFPSCVLAAAAELIVPELTQEQMRRDESRIRRAVRGFLGLSLLYAAAAAALLFVFAGPLGRLLFHSEEAARSIRLLAPLVPVMYLDMSVDGCLKGLGQQVWSMGINVLDSLSGLLLVWLLLPRYGLPGYLFVVVVTETLNFLLSGLRLLTVLRASPAGAARRWPARPGQRA